MSDKSVAQRFSRATGMEPGAPPSLQARLVNRVVRVGAKAFWAATPDTPAGLLAVRRATDLQARLERIPKGVRIERETFDRFNGEWVRAGAVDESKAFLYLHGGGYFFGSPTLYRTFTWRLSASTRRPVLAIDYRLAPEHTPADSLTDALVAYESLLKRGYPADKIVVGGDSAGGHLTLALLMALKEHGAPLPAAAVCLSPWADLMCEGESHLLNKRTDALIPARKLAWLGRSFCEGKERTDPLFSPVHGDYAGLPPLMLIASGSEILLDDSRRVAELAAKAGVDVVLQEWQGLIHVFAIFADWMPEGKAAFRQMARFLTERGA